MFRCFFLQKKWMFWSILGSILIIGVTIIKVQIDVEINKWFGDFYDYIQKVLQDKNSVEESNFNELIFFFVKLAGIYVILAVSADFFVKHWVFRWRTAMNDYYIGHWDKLRSIEGAAQRVQEDTMRFARIMESLGISFLRSVLTLIAFLPILWELSKPVKELPIVGEIPHGLVFVAILFALGGTVLMAAVGIKLPGLEFNNQRVEAAYRKELVYGEDDEKRADPETNKVLFTNVRDNYFRLFFHYMYFDIVKWSYVQYGVMVPYLALGPTIVGGLISLGMLQQIVRAFGKVESSFQFLVHSWSVIVELISVYKRLRAFEDNIRQA